jgi:hypothetical protein
MPTIVQCLAPLVAGDAEQQEAMCKPALDDGHLLKTLPIVPASPEMPACLQGEQPCVRLPCCAQRVTPLSPSPQYICSPQWFLPGTASGSDAWQQ